MDRLRGRDLVAERSLRRGPTQPSMPPPKRLRLTPAGEDSWDEEPSIYRSFSPRLLPRFF
eukprot:9490065-Pyramimonas_sp.AAC.1